MAHTLQGKRVAILAADGVERVELETPREAVQNAVGQTKLLSLMAGEIQARNNDLESAGTFPVTERSPTHRSTTMTPGGPRSVGTHRNYGWVLLYFNSSTTKRKITMAKKALLVRLEAKPGKEGAVEDFLVSSLPLVEQEPDTKPWFAVRFGPSTFGIFDAFPDDAAREAHLGGAVGKALAAKADELFASPPEISNLDVLANKL